MSPPRETTRRVRGLELCVCEWGPADGPLTVLLHGWLEHGGFWWRVAERLAAAGRRVQAPDARGHGRSGHLGPGGAYHFSDYVVDLDGLVDRPVHLVGHSMGGTVASLFAAARPEKVLSLTLSEGLGPPSETLAQGADRLRTHLDHMAREWPAPALAFEDAVERMRRGWPSLSDEDAAALARRQHRDGRWSYDPLHKSRNAIGFDLDRHLEQLRRVRAPSSLALGSRSWYQGIDRLQERIDALAPRSVSTLDGGHSLHLEAADALADIVLQVGC